ncbi:MAG: hypothetical protein AB7D36_00090 [Oscillospiraceae bacterium]
MRIKTVASLLAVLIILPTLLFLAIDALGGRTSQEALEMTREGLDRAAVQCYALEGFYPPSLSYLTENYGVTVDTDRYFVDYQYVGSNLMPDITVLDLSTMG